KQCLFHILLLNQLKCAAGFALVAIGVSLRGQSQDGRHVCHVKEGATSYTFGKSPTLIHFPCLNLIFSQLTPTLSHLFTGSYDDSAPSGLQWHSGQGQGFAQGGIGLRDNQIIIPESGLYFVYSQASFRVSCQHGPDEDGRQRKPLSHRVWRYSESMVGEVSLMSAIRSACAGQQQQSRAEAGHGWYNAIYLGAVFQLHKGDRLWTETNSLSELETEEGKTFFGVFALF
uniref:Lymphotoxin-alpha n=1 Tax=Neogobius melanostomus TaxID=47308 RepID=A0A8C6TGA4_9GOBI